MIIDTNGVDVGRKVWVMGSEFKKEMCDKCEGEKMLEVTYKDEKLKIKCNKCRGNGFSNKFLDVIVEKEVERIEVYVTKEKGTEIYVHVHNAIGVRSYELTEVFHSKEECEDYYKIK